MSVVAFTRSGPQASSEALDRPGTFRVPGGLVDRSRPLRFTFDGRTFTGYAGDTLASALLANNVTLVGRSFKYHRPRGILSAGPEEPNALVTLGTGGGGGANPPAPAPAGREEPNALVTLGTGGRREPNLPATMLELGDGMAAGSQNRWPSL